MHLITPFIGYFLAVHAVAFPGYCVNNAISKTSKHIDTNLHDSNHSEHQFIDPELARNPNHRNSSLYALGYHNAEHHVIDASLPENPNDQNSILKSLAHPENSTNENQLDHFDYKDTTLEERESESEHSGYQKMSLEQRRSLKVGSLETFTSLRPIHNNQNSSLEPLAHSERSIRDDESENSNYEDNTLEERDAEIEHPDYQNMTLEQRGLKVGSLEHFCGGKWHFTAVAGTKDGDVTWNYSGLRGGCFAFPTKLKLKRVAMQQTLCGSRFTLWPFKNCQYPQGYSGFDTQVHVDNGDYDLTRDDRAWVSPMYAVQIETPETKHTVDEGIEQWETVDGSPPGLPQLNEPDNPVLKLPDLNQP